MDTRYQTISNRQFKTEPHLLYRAHLSLNAAKLQRTRECF